MSCPWYLHPELLEGDLQRGMASEFENTREGTRQMPASIQMVMDTRKLSPIILIRQSKKINPPGTARLQISLALGLILPITRRESPITLAFVFTMTIYQKEGQVRLHGHERDTSPLMPESLL